MNDRAQVLTALLHELAGDQRIPHHRAAGRPICVAPLLARAPVAGTRQPSPSDIKFDAPAGQPRLPWRPDTEAEARARLWWVDRELPADTQARALRIQDAMLAASSRPMSDAPPARVERTWLASNQSFKRRGCVETQAISEPDIALGYAFVTVSVECGGLCGMNALYVLRREAGAWRVVDGRIDTIS